MIINAEFRETKQVAAAVGELRGQGTGAEHMEIFSSKPVELEPGLLDRPSHMSLFAVLAALAAGTGVTAFMFYTQQDYPLVTGGMPLTSGWATGVVTFEMTMAGAILGTVFMFLWESGLLRRSRRAAPEIPDDCMILQVDCRGDVAPAEEALRRRGARHIETWEEPE